MVSSHRARSSFAHPRIQTPHAARCTVIVVNLLGNGVSTSPSNVAPPDDRDRYPLVTVFDNVNAQAALLDHIGGESFRSTSVGLPLVLTGLPTYAHERAVEKIALIYGYSMGAMQALHWACLYPDRVLRIAAVCGAARTGDYNKVFLESLRAAASADPAYANGWFAEVRTRQLEPSSWQ